MREAGMSWEELHLGHDTAIYASKIVAEKESGHPGFATAMQRLRKKIAETIQQAQNSKTSVQSPISSSDFLKSDFSEISG